MLSPRAIATLGIGYGPALMARLGVWQTGDALPEENPIQPGAFAPLSRASSPITRPFKRRSKKRREEELLFL